MIVSRFSGYRIILRAIVVVMATDRRDRLPPIDTALVVVPSFSCLSFHVSSHISSRVHVQKLKNKSHSRVALEATFRDHFIALRCCRWLVHVRLETLRSKDTYPPPSPPSLLFSVTMYIRTGIIIRSCCDNNGAAHDDVYTVCFRSSLTRVWSG